MSTPFIGEIRMFGFGRVPIGWQACDGSLLPIAEYEPLYVLISTIYGGDGVQNFRVPDLRGRLPIHQGQGAGLQNYVIGAQSGTETITLLPSQMPTHSHSVVASTAAATTATPSTGVVPAAISGDTLYTNSTTGLTALAANPQAVSSVGGAQSHNNLMPTLTMNFCIAVDGIFPQQA